MNKVITMGRLTADPKVSQTTTGKKVARFNLALDRMKDGADFPSYIAWEKRAEFLEKWCHKGMRLLIEGHLQTGTYEKDGHKVYTTDVVCDVIEFCDKKRDQEEQPKESEDWVNIPDGIQEELPFT